MKNFVLALHTLHACTLKYKYNYSIALCTGVHVYMCMHVCMYVCMYSMCTHEYSSCQHEQ